MVDDDSFNLMAMRSVLDSLKFSSSMAFNGKEAIEIFLARAENPCGPECKPYKVIFLDCNMPVMDGYECATKLKELFNEIPDY